MGTWNTWKVEINILVYENEMFSLPAEFHFNNSKPICTCDKLIQVLVCETRLFCYKCFYYMALYIYSGTQKIP